MTTTAWPKSVTPSVAVPSASQPASESRVDRDSHFNGLYETKQNLRIEGVAEGEIQCDGTLTVAEGARVKAKVTASTMTIAGELEGEVVCRGVFQIMPTGQVEATVSAHRLIVQEGGFYNGEFHMITEESRPAERNPTAQARPVSREKPKPTEAKSADSPLSTDEWWAKMSGTEPTAEPKKDDSEAKSA